MHIVTESGDQSIVWRSNQLTYIGQDRHELPSVLATKFGHLATKLDLSYNSLTSFKNINLFTNLNELILDNNELEDDQLDFRLNLRLKTLSLNKNKLTDLYKLINSIKVCYPNLEYLSLIGNPLCPGPMLMNFKAAHNDHTGQFLVASANGQLKANNGLENDPNISIGGIKQIDELILGDNRAHRVEFDEDGARLSNGDMGGIRQQWADATSMMIKKPIAKSRLDDRLMTTDEFSHQKYR